MVNLAFNAYNVTKAPGSADLFAYPTAARYRVSDVHIFTFYVKSRQAKVEYTAGKTNSQPIFEDNFYTLALHIPPSEITFTHNKELTRTKVRGGWVIERWGDTLVSIEASGQTGIFFKGNEGVTRVDAYQTHAYAELMELFQIYKNNGMSYNPDHGTIDTISEVVLSYGGINYRGSFDAFNYSESADRPYGFNYSFVFVARGDSSEVLVTGHYVDTPVSKVVESNEANDYLKSMVKEEGSMIFIAGLKNQANMLLHNERIGKRTLEELVDNMIKATGATEDQVKTVQKAVEKRVEDVGKGAQKALNGTGEVLQTLATNLILNPFQRFQKGIKSPTEPAKPKNDRTQPDSQLPPAPARRPPPPPAPAP